MSVPNKIGIQLQNKPNDVEQAFDAQALSYKFLGQALDLGLVQECRNRAPNAILVLRAAGGDQDYRKPAQIYADYVCAVLERFHNAGLCDIAEHINEPGFRDSRDLVASQEDAKALCAHAVDFNRILHARGYKTLVYNFSVGVPASRFVPGAPSVWKELLDGIKTGDMLGLHEYGAPRMRDGEGFYCGRVEYVVAELALLGVAPAIAITETGIDRGLIAGSGGGYKNPDHEVTIADYVDDLKWYAQKLAAIPLVKFAHVFLFGSGSNLWTTFDVADREEDRREFISFMKWSPPGGAPVINPPVTPAYSGKVPFASGYKITQRYGENAAYYSGLNVGIASHEGLDLIPLDADWTMHAIEPGIVTRVSTFGNYGIHVYIFNAATKRRWVYAHLAAMHVAAGQVVEKGSDIGVMGATGNAAGAHLHLGLQQTDSAGTAINTDNGNLGYIDPLPVLEGTTGELKMSTPQERINAAWGAGGIDYNPDAALPKKALALNLGRAVANEYRYTAADGKVMVGQGFNTAILECVNGDWGNIKAYDWLTGELYSPATNPPPVVVPPVVAPPPVSGLQPYKFPDVLTAYGAAGEEGQPVAGQPFYRLTGATVKQGVSAFMVVVVYGRNGIPVPNVAVVNMFPDGHGEIIYTDGAGVSRFQFGASSAFTSPGAGPFTIFLADGAVKDEDTKMVTYAKKLSDTVKSLGDYQGSHTEFSIQFVAQP